MAEYKELDKFLDASLTLPYRGRKYEIPDPGWENVLWLEGKMKALGRAASGGELDDADREVLSDADTDALFEVALGSAYDEMIDDGCASAFVKHAGLTAVMHWSVGEEQARAFWESGGNPELMAASVGNRRARRAAQSTQKQGSRSGTSRNRRGAQRSAKSSRTGRSSSLDSPSTTE